MTPEVWRRICAIANEAVTLAGPQRAACLDRSCGDDEELRAWVERLLREQECSSSFLELPVTGLGFHAGRPVPPDTPTQLGAYRIERLLGSGGMGDVYLAEQQTPRRHVALKLLKPALVFEETVRRFEREAELLGRVQHAGVAQIYEAGVVETAEGPRSGSGLVLVLVPGGVAWIGAEKAETSRHHDPEAHPDEGPVNLVTLAPFFISKFEMTQGQWLRIMGANPSQIFNRKNAKTGRQLSIPTDPVETVSWNDCRKALWRLGLVIPTEAQWEYAARAGTDTPWWTGAKLASLEGAANLRETPDWSDGFTYHAPVGHFIANTFGLHDVHGNVAEWCRDEYDDRNRYDLRSGDGLLMGDGQRRTIHGGGWSSTPVFARIGLRDQSLPQNVHPSVGVRPALDLTR